MQVTHPAEINMSSYKQVAISDIHGNLGQSFAGGLKERLVESGRFQVVDRQRLDQIMGELRLSSSDLADSSKAKKMGKILPAAALITGHTDGNYDENIVYRDETCVDDKKNKYPCRRYIRNGTYRTSGSIDVIDVATGQIMKSKVQGNKCEDSTQAINGTPVEIDRSSLASKCLTQNLVAFTKAISPWTETVQAPFKTDKSIPELETGVSKVRLGDLKAAVDTFHAAANSAEMNAAIKPKVIAKAYWNLGLAYQYSGEFDKATEAFKKAYSLDSSESCLAEIENCKKLRVEKKKLAEQQKS
jgi:tetratricopeptide (TPR) repeat protein